MLCIVETEEKSQKDRVLSKNILLLMSWHKILVPALATKLNMDV